MANDDITLDEAAKVKEKKPSDAMVKYKCNKTCYFGNVLYHEGDIVVISRDKKMPAHFTILS